MGCLPLPGAIYMWKRKKKQKQKKKKKKKKKKTHIKTEKKSDFKEICFKLATNGQIDKGFLLTLIFVPKGLSASALGLYTCIKGLKYVPGPGVRWAFTGSLVLWLQYSIQSCWDCYHFVFSASKVRCLHFVTVAVMLFHLIYSNSY